MSTKKRCTVCGATSPRVEYPEEFPYDNAGLSGVVLRGRGVRIVHCEECGTTTTTISDEQQLLQVLGLILVSGPPGMKGEELRFLRRLFGMTQAEFAGALAAGRRKRRETVAEWEAQGRIWPQALDEVTPRLMLLNMFKAKVIDEGPCFLAQDHIESFQNYSCSFVAQIQTLLDARRFRTVRVSHKKREWNHDEDLVTV